MWNLEEESVTVKDYTFLFEVDAVQTDEGRYVTMLNPDSLVEVRDLIDTHLSQMREEIDEATRETVKERTTVITAQEKKKRTTKKPTGRGQAKSTKGGDAHGVGGGNEEVGTGTNETVDGTGNGPS
jgi:uncharacterized sporulation protein YeaH/YhbH (DUF444 family)